MVAVIVACGGGGESGQNLRSHPVLGDYQLHEELRLDLVAREPLIRDPVDLEFDAYGHAYVLEMGGYPSVSEGERPGRIVRLRDEDGDGVYDEHTVFADGFRYADSIAPAYGGFLVADPPDLVYVRDTTGDGVADLRQTLLTGFAVGPSESNFNGLGFGPDGWYHGANGSSGGSVRLPGAPESEGVSIRGLDFRFRVAPSARDRHELDLLGFETTDRMGGGFGLDWDRWGRRFVTHEQKHIQAVVMPRRYFDERYEWPPLTVEISDHGRGGQTEVFPVSRTPQRPNHPEQAGMFTSGCGLTYYDGDALPASFRGSFFVAEPVHNLVHRDVVSEQAGGFVARRAEREADSEPLAATDPSFRPVNFAVGPDGGLYVVDMYREVIEHPEWIPDEMEAGVDVVAGADRGRVYRLASRESTWPTNAAASLAEMSPGELMESLGSGNAWRRRTALRLLVEQGLDREEGERGGVLEWLGLAVETSRSNEPRARVGALWALAAVGQLDRDVVVERLGDEHHGVLENALRLSEPFASDEGISGRYLDLAKRGTGRVRNQALLSLRAATTGLDGATLVELARSVADDEHAGLALLSAAAADPVRSFEHLLHASGESAELVEPMLAGLASIVGQRAQLDELGRLLELLAIDASQQLEAARIVDALASDLDIEGHDADRAQSQERESMSAALREILSRVSGDDVGVAAVWQLASSLRLDLGEAQRAAEMRAVDLWGDGLSTAERAHRLALLERFRPPEHRDLLVDVLRRGLATSLQVAAIEQLGRMPSAEVGEQLVSVFQSLPPEPRRAAGDVLLYRKQHHDALVSALEEGTLSVGELNLHLERRRTLLWWAEPEIRERAAKLFSDLGVFTRRAVIEQFSEATEIPGDATDGRVVFAQLCARCHVHGRYGRNIGPDLTDIGRRSRASLLHDILDPNARIAPEYLVYDVETKDGELVSGLLSEDGSETLVLTSADGGSRRLARDDVEEVYSSGLSLMPEELEIGLSAEDVAGLLAFLERGA